jgi:CRP-like cAMP-binding protein
MSTTIEPIRRLRELSLFRNSTPRELAAIDALGTPVQVSPGRVLCRERTVGREFLVIVDGAVALTQRGRVIGRLGPGSGVGALSLVDHGPHLASATTLLPTDLLVFNRAEFATLLDVAPGVVRELLGRMAALLRATDFDDITRRQRIREVGFAA